MVNLIIGRSGSGKSRTLTDMIEKDVREGREAVLIVPEQETVVWESKMAKKLPVSANLCLEITNFTRLCDSVFRKYGASHADVIDEGGRMLLVWSAMMSVSAELDVYRNPAGRRRDDKYVSSLASAIEELKLSAITPAALESALCELEADEAAEAGESGEAAERGTSAHEPKSSPLTRRLRDALLVYSAYEAILSEKGADRGDILAALADSLARNKYFAKKRVYIDSFFSLTAPQYRILERIIEQADEVTLTFTMPACDFASGSASDEMQFGEVREYYSRARALCARCGADCRVTRMTENLRHGRGSLLSCAERYIFDYGVPVSSICPPETVGAGESDGRENGGITLIRCGDKYDEAEAAAAIIKRLTREGYRYSDIAVVARDMGKYEGVIDSVLRRHGIKCFISEVDATSKTPAVKFVASALSVLSGGWQRADVIRLIKTGLLPLDDGEDDIFENYTETWNINSVILKIY